MKKIYLITFTSIFLLSGCYNLDQIEENYYNSMILGKTEYGNVIYNRNDEFMKLHLNMGLNHYFYEVETQEDDFNDVIIRRQINNIGYDDERDIQNLKFHPSLNMMYYDYKVDSLDNVLLQVLYRGMDWIHMKSLIFKIGDEKIEYDISLQSRKTEVITGNSIKEWCVLDITKEDLDKLLNCDYKDLQIRLYGDSYYTDVKFVGYVQNNWKEFYSQYVSE